jgi:hypothetical protein
MTQIDIPLTTGDNFISFRATSTSTIHEILTSSGIEANISKFIKWDSIQQKEIPVDIDGIEYIEEGRGYYLHITLPGTITYEGTEYTTTFEQFKSRIVQNWNLLGTGKDIIVPQTWCNIVDPITSLPVTILQPDHSYWVNYDECIQPTTSTGELVGIVASVLVSIAILKQFKIL